MLKKIVMAGLLFCGNVLFTVSSFAEGVVDTRELLLFQEIPIISASLKAEPINEIPVVANVITAEQIQRMGARTLEDVLLTIPGFHLEQDQDEISIGTRGIYASGQQKILVMRDGHRLNTHTHQSADLDDHISLTGVDHIEILRGAGGSLYGDVALMGVVNLISKKGSSINGTYLDLGAGNFGQRQVDLLIGQAVGEDADLMAFAHIFSAPGEPISLSASQDFNTPALSHSGETIVGGVDNPYDVGLRARIGSWTVAAEKAFFRPISPRSNTGNNGGIIYPGYINKINGWNVGYGTRTSNFYAEYCLKIGDMDLTVIPSYDEATSEVNQISAANRSQTMIVWGDNVIGLKAYINGPYASPLGKGTWTAGIQQQYMSVVAEPVVSFNPVTNVWAVPYTGEKLLVAGTENYYSAFGQVKHFISDQLILNLGARYDYVARALNTGTQQ